MTSDDQWPVRSSQPYAPQREALVRRICPDLLCHWCRCVLTPATTDLDHVGTRDYILDRLNRYQRLRVIQREWLAAGGRVGHWIVGSCDDCNAKRGHARTKGGTVQFYVRQSKARRSRRGKGYSTASYVTRQAEHYRKQQPDPPF